MSAIRGMREILEVLILKGVRLPISPA